MRTSILAAFLALALPACMTGIEGTGGDPSTGGGGGGGSGGGSGSGMGSGSGSGSGSSETPALAATADKTSITTELKTDTVVMFQVTGSGGFQGDVALSGSVVDNTNIPIGGYTVTFSSPTMNLAQNGSQTAMALVHVPSLNAGVAGTVKLVADSSAGQQVVSIPLTVTNQITYVIQANGAACAYPAGISNAAPDKVKVGTKVRFLNMTNGNIIVHSNGGADGIAHENTGGTGTAPNAAYEQTLSGTTTAKFSWYCHTPATDLGTDNPYIQATP